MILPKMTFQKMILRKIIVHKTNVGKIGVHDVRRKLSLILLCGAVGVAAGCGGSSSSKNTIVTSGTNVQPITVNAGPNGNYANGAFISVNVCAPGSSSNCQTIDGILVDTGSFGLRILSSALTVALPQQTATDGNPVAECVPFAGSYTWGPVQTADVHISGETASSVPIQVLNQNAFSPLPTACKNLGLPPANTLSELNANGILGVGQFVQDCGSPCSLYYECPSSGCVVTNEPLTSQVANPVGLFATDNNGVIVELPAVNGTAPTVSGSLVFGIGTQSNNGMGGATVYADNQDADITTEFSNQSYPTSFLDSGSNGIFFLDTATTGLPLCSSGDGFYCPNSTQNFKATNMGANGSSGQISFSVDNADATFNGAAAYSDLAGPGPPGGAFDWGLPFFYGRNVFTAIDGANTPQGTGPYWAY